MENNLNNRMNEKVLPIVAAVVGHSIWGFSYLFTRMALSVTSPDVLLTVRFSIAFLILNILILTGKFKLSLKGKSAGLLAAFSIMEPIYFYCESYGILYTNVTYSGGGSLYSSYRRYAVCGNIHQRIPCEKAVGLLYSPYSRRDNDNAVRKRTWNNQTHRYTAAGLYVICLSRLQDSQQKAGRKIYFLRTYLFHDRSFLGSLRSHRSHKGKGRSVEIYSAAVPYGIPHTRNHLKRLLLGAVL